MTALEQAVKDSLEAERKLNEAKRELRRNPFSLDIRMQVRTLSVLFEKTLVVVEEERAAL